MSQDITFNAHRYRFRSHLKPGEPVEFDTDGENPIHINSSLLTKSVQLPTSAAVPTQTSNYNMLYTDSTNALKMKQTDGTIVSVGGAPTIPFVLDATGEPDNAEVFRVRDNNGVNTFMIREDGHILDNCASMAIFTGSDYQSNYVVPSNMPNPYWALDQAGDTINLLASSLTADTNYTKTNVYADFFPVAFVGSSNLAYFRVARDMLVDIDCAITLRSVDYTNPTGANLNARQMVNALGMQTGNFSTGEQLMLKFNAIFCFYATELVGGNYGTGTWQQRLRTFERELPCYTNGAQFGKSEWDLNFRFQLPLQAMCTFGNGNQCGYNMRLVHDGGTSSNGTIGLQVKNIKWTLVKIADKPCV